jgi:hypothetical protein
MLREDDTDDDDLSEASSVPEYSPLSVETPSIQRLMKRDMSMKQSWGRFNLKRLGVRHGLLSHNFFFLLLTVKAWKLVLGCFTVYMVAWVAFAAWWFQISDACNIGLNTYRSALYLSIETMMTIGYGVPDPFFNDCWEALPLIICQSFVGLLIDLAIVGMLFQRLSRSFARASTLVFSDKLLLRRRENHVELALRIAEMQARPLLQVVMQAYVVLHRRDVQNAPAIDDDTEAHCEDVIVRALHLQGLDDNNNALLCAIPMTITHTIDRESPLSPCNRYAMNMTHDSTLSETITNLRSMPYLEVIVMVSGTEESTGNAVEGRQSYIIQEIVSGHEFGRCVTVNQEGVHCVDFDHFNDIFAVASQE